MLVFMERLVQPQGNVRFPEIVLKLPILASKLCRKSLSPATQFAPIGGVVEQRDWGVMTHKRASRVSGLCRPTLAICSHASPFAAVERVIAADRSPTIPDNWSRI